jgi:hypothetical protein
MKSALLVLLGLVGVSAVASADDTPLVTDAPRVVKPDEITARDIDRHTVGVTAFKSGYSISVFDGCLTIVNEGHFDLGTYTGEIAGSAIRPGETASIGPDCKPTPKKSDDCQSGSACS